MNRRVVIAGMGVVAPAGIGKMAFWNSISRGVSCVRTIEGSDASPYRMKIAALVRDFDPSKYLSPQKIYATDRLSQFALVASSEALSDSQPAVDEKNKRRIEVIWGSSDEVDYINAHSTATQISDKGETEAIKSVFGKRAYSIPISSTKSMIGHLPGAAGGVEIITTVLAIKNQFLPATINYEIPDTECDLDYIPNKGRENRIRVGMSNSLGFGGASAVGLLKEFS